MGRDGRVSQGGGRTSGASARPWAQVAASIGLVQGESGAGVPRQPAAHNPEAQSPPTQPHNNPVELEPLFARRRRSECSSDCPAGKPTWATRFRSATHTAETNYATRQTKPAPAVLPRQPAAHVDRSVFDVVAYDIRTYHVFRSPCGRIEKALDLESAARGHRPRRRWRRRATQGACHFAAAMAPETPDEGAAPQRRRTRPPRQPAWRLYGDGVADRGEPPTLRRQKRAAQFAAAPTTSQSEARAPRARGRARRTLQLRACTSSRRQARGKLTPASILGRPNGQLQRVP